MLVVLSEQRTEAVVQSLTCSLRHALPALSVTLWSTTGYTIYGANKC